MKKLYRMKKELISITCLVAVIIAVLIENPPMYDSRDPSAENDPGISEEDRSEADTDTASIPITEQINVILSHKEVWLKEEVRMEIDAIDDKPYADGPYYSLMDLDQDGYLELIAYNETGRPYPSFYEVTGDKCLKRWTIEGDIPQAEDSCIFDTTCKADCYYDSSQNKYYYIVRDNILLDQSDANVSYLAMTPSNGRVIFKKIGKYTFDASTDGEFHYYDSRGKKCTEAEITKYYLPLTKKTMYYAHRAISKKEAETLTAEDMAENLWDHFILRDDYRCEKEKELTEEILHQFVFLAISMDEYVENIGEPGDHIRYAATDLDEDQTIEVIIENKTKKTYCIFQESDPDTYQWSTEGKELVSFTQKADSIFWQTCTIPEFKEQCHELIADNLRESWLQFSL